MVTHIGPRGLVALAIGLIAAVGGASMLSSRQPIPAASAGDAASAGGAVVRLPEIKLQVGPRPGALAVVNAGATSIGVRPLVVVEHFNDGDSEFSPHGWQPLTTEMKIVPTCARPYGVAPSIPACVVIAPRQTYVVPRWTGASCSGQCNMSCRANAYYPGKTRFRVHLCGGGDVVSPTFVMPRTWSPR